MMTCTDHPVLRHMVDWLHLRQDGRRLLTYVTHADADMVLSGVRCDGLDTIFDAALRERVRGGARSIRGWRARVPGQHTALNPAAATAVPAEAASPVPVIRQALSSFS